jgi:hypothetical protein
MIFEADCIKQKYLKASLIRQNHWRKFRIETIYRDETMVLPREWLDFIKNDIQQVQYLPAGAASPPPPPPPPPPEKTRVSMRPFFKRPANRTGQ